MWVIQRSQKITNYIKFYRHLRYTGISASAVLIALTTLAIFPLVNHISTAEASSGTATASETNLAMTINHGSAGVDLVVRDASGTFATSNANTEAQFGVATNNYTGYTLSIAHASSDAGLLTNSASGASLSSISTYTDADTFATGSTAAWRAPKRTAPSSKKTSASRSIPSPI